MKIADSRLGVCYFFWGGDDLIFRYFDNSVFGISFFFDFIFSLSSLLYR